MLLLRTYKKYWWVVALLLPVFAILTRVWEPSSLIMPYPRNGYLAYLELFLPMLLLVPLSMMLFDRYEIELALVCGVSTTKLMLQRVLALVSYAYGVLALFVLIFRYTPYVPDPTAKLIFPIVIPEGYRWYMLLSLAVTLLFFTALFLFFRVVTRNCYLPVGLGLFVFLFFKERSQDIQTAALGPERALFDPFISCYFLGSSVPASLSLPHLWTLNRLLFLDLGLLLLVVSCLLLRREKLHEGFGE